MVRRTVLWIVALLALAGGRLTAQDGKELTPRELFYGESSSKKPAPVTTSQSSTRNPNTPASSRVQGASKGESTTNATPSARNPAPKQATGHVGAVPNSETRSPTPIAPFNAAYKPLGLRYSVLKRTQPRGPFVETDVNATFRSGDGIRVSLESNDDAYLYIVNKGSSGTWSVLFPAPDINNGENRVRAHNRIEIPAAGQFTFVDEPGDERVFVVLSRRPEPDLEQLISSLIRTDQPDLTANSISDELIGKLSTGVIARDLVFEKVQDETSGRNEEATYVVNVKRDGSSQVVAGLSLRHQ